MKLYHSALHYPDTLFPYLTDPGKRDNMLVQHGNCPLGGKAV
ncbi:MAG: hypothetical protein RL020_1694 [Pseudomonadota bacterium]|jgi:hypothetical protein